MSKSKIKFSVKNNPEFINELRKKVKDYFEINNLSKYGNYGMVLKTCFMFSLYIVPYILLLSAIIHTIPLFFISWLIMGFGMAGLGLSVMHDANHRSYSRNIKVNKWLSKSMYLLGGYPRIWQYQHNVLHHGYTNIEDHDEDIDPGPVLRFSPHKPLYKLHRFQHYYFWFFYGIMTLSWITSKEFIQLFRYRKEKIKLGGKVSFYRLLTELILSKILYYIIFLVIPMIVLSMAWYWTLLAFLAMHFICGFTLAIIFGSAHVVPSSEYPLPDDQGSMENNWAIHQLLTTTNFSPRNKIFTWLIGGLNYQVEHHLFPNICHVHYKNIAGMVRDTARKYNLPYYVEPSFYSAVRSHIIMLEMLGKQQSFHSVLIPA